MQRSQSMRKKKYLKITAVVCLLSIGLFSFRPCTPQPLGCPFCTESIISAQTFYEDELAFAMVTYKPIFPGHCLIIPKRHMERFEELTDVEMVAMGRVIRVVDRIVSEVFKTSSYLLLQKNGVEVGQSVPHIHVHYIPRKKGESSVFVFLTRMFLAHLLPPVSTEKMAQEVTLLRKAAERLDTAPL